MIEFIHSCTGLLLIPVLVVLIGLCIFSLYSIGSCISEFLVERRYYKNVIPSLLSDLSNASFDELSEVIQKSNVLVSQKKALLDLIEYLHLPKHTRSEVAKRLISQEVTERNRVLDRTIIVSKIAPMLGLMGTLIPLGPGLMALSTGNVEMLSQSLMVAFDTTILGLFSAVICYFISRIRKRWYNEYTSNIQSIMIALLERAEGLNANAADK